MTSCAIVSFHGFGELEPTHCLLPRHGEPEAAARCLAEALANALANADGPSDKGYPFGHSQTLAEFMAAFLNGQRAVELINNLKLEAAATYRYRISVMERRSEQLWLECWRLYPGDPGWKRRCGPMPLRAFIHHYRRRGQVSQHLPQAPNQTLAP